MATLLKTTRRPATPRRDSQTPLRPQGEAKLRRWRLLIEQALERALPKAAAAPHVVHEGMRYCVFSGGKRFRPLLCLAAAEAVGGRAQQALPVACAIELIHTYSLVHDDLPAMDNADERRGQPTCHRKFGEGNAILIGDALLTLAFDLLSASASLGTESRAKVEGLSRNGLPRALAVIRTISRACGTAGLIGGQVLDLQAISQPHGSTVQTLTDIAQRKTGALITASVVSGALAGGGRPQQVKQLERYGQDVGLAFQLIDDVHDQEGLARSLGLDEAKAQAHNRIAHAVELLKPFGPAAASLRQIAQWLATT